MFQKKSRLTPRQVVSDMVVFAVQYGLASKQLLHLANLFSASLNQCTGQEAPGSNVPKRRGLTITTARKNIVNGSASSQIATSKGNTTLPQLAKEASKETIPAQQAQRRQKTRKEQLPTVSSVSLDAIPGLRRQASALDPEQAKQREQGWGLSYKNASTAVPARKEVCS